VLHGASDSDLVTLRAFVDRHRSDRTTTLVVIGGGAAFSKSALAAGSPMRTLHVDDDGVVREARGMWRPSAPRFVIESALDHIASDLEEGGFPAIDFETARSLANRDAIEAVPPAKPIRGPVTTALTAAILVTFAAQVFFSRDSLTGDGAAMAVAYRMGAIHRPALLEGEWQRLLAAPFLHFGLVHIVMNGWAQWTLATPLEFIAGSKRLLAIWLLSALGASLTSFAFNPTAVSAGASGAVFGLLGAFTAFVFLRKDILPQPVPSALRRGVVTTLFLNLLISFIPGIDMAAHAGGFLTGGVAALLLVRRNDRGRSLGANTGLLRLAVVLVLIAGVGWTSVRRRVDLIARPPRIASSREVHGVSIPVPSGLSFVESGAGSVATLESISTPADPFGVIYRVSAEQADEAAARHLSESFRGTPGGDADSDWIALSRVGIERGRAIEVMVTAPRSLRREAEDFGAALANAIR